MNSTDKPVNLHNSSENESKRDDTSCLTPPNKIKADEPSAPVKKTKTTKNYGSQIDISKNLFK